ncbi:VirB8/TrbF family protein [Phascolarctobacterium sp.]
MAFSNKTQDYKIGKEVPETPYSNAKEVWDKLFGAAVVRFKTWRMIACISMVLNLALVLGICFIGSRSSIMPYIVQVDEKSGTILSVDRVDARSQANETEIEYFLWNVTRKARTLPKDLVLYKQNWEEVYSYLDQSCANKMNNMAIAEDYQTKISNGNTTMLKLKGFNKYSGQDNTYQIRWDETLYDASGKVISNYSMEAFYTIDFVQVTNETIHLNPLGIQIKDFSVSQER